ncbi:MAG TPA: TonB-dependent receptor plug domain-containing protein, partial [Pyrinomonadaceae bacterium]|nr:TonB-dependent receptor plug domain-containing protein [Pyrinomonadaceae bacterium]
MRITQSYKFSPVDKFSLVKLLLACALALCSSCAFAALAQTSPTTNTLAGRVLDPQGAGVAGAVVTLYARSPQLRLTTRADANGAYRFERVAPGEYLLEADAQGFAPASARRVRVERGAAGVTLDLALEVAGVRAEVVVTAADSPQSTDEVSKAITTVGEREIEERNEYSIPEALRTVPGLRVQQLGGPGAFVSIKTRGLRNQDTAVLVDGLRFRDPSSPQGDASGYLSDLLVTGTSRVEVLRGSGSSLYGSNAIGGVVNVVTDEGGAPTHGSLLAEGGSLGLFRGRARLAGGSGANRVAYSVGLSHLYVARGVDGDDGAYNTSGQGRVLFRLTPTATLSARAYAADAFVELNNNPSSVANTFAPNPIIAVPLARDILRLREAGDFEGFRNLRGATFIPSTNDPDATRSTRFFSGALVFNHRPTERFGYTVSYQGNVNNGKFDDGGARDGSIFGPSASFTRLQGRAHTLNARADWQPGGSQLITAGYEFEREWFSNKNVIPTFPELDTAVQVAEHSHTFFIQDQIRLLADRLQLSASFRAQHFTLSAPRFTPDDALSPFANFDFAAPPNAYTGDGSIAYLVRTTGTKLRGHVGNGYRAPSLFERFGSFDSFSSNPEFPTIFFAFGDPRLRPERSLAFDAGLDQTLARNRVRASATYFYTRLQEV